MDLLNRRAFVASIGAATLTAGAAQAATSAAVPAASKKLTDEECLASCRACEQTCLQTVRHCLSQGGEHVKGEHLALMLDCAKMCATSAAFMISKSDLHPKVCALCAEVCDRCAQACAKVPGDEQMKACIEACKHCVDTCRSMAGHAH